MAGYTLQGKTSSGDMVDIPLAATYDSAGADITKTYATKEECKAIDNKLGDYLKFTDVTFSVNADGELIASY